MLLNGILNFKIEQWIERGTLIYCNKDQTTLCEPTSTQSNTPIANIDSIKSSKGTVIPSLQIGDTFDKKLLTWNWFEATLRMHR